MSKPRKSPSANENWIKQETVDEQKKQAIVSLDKGCIGLGMLDQIPTVETGSIYISPGSKLVAFTDGLIELDNGMEIDNGMDDITAIVQKPGTINQTIQEIENLMSKMIHRESVFDDVTLLGIEFHSRGL